MTFSIGVDLAEIDRFKRFKKSTARTNSFIQKTFSKEEQAYCFSYRDPAPHLAGTFAVKEAVQKASGNFLIPLPYVEVRRAKTGKPELWLKNRRARSFTISISHSQTTACAVVLLHS
jgi:holo-[acyl-carrier protein] synthase